MRIDNLVIGFILLIFVFGGLNLYVASRLYCWLVLIVPVNVIVYIVVYTLLMLSVVFGEVPLPLPSSINKKLRWVGGYWMSVFFYLLAFFALADLLLLIGSATKLIPSDMYQDALLCSGALVVLLTAVVVAYGLHNAGQVRTVSYNIELDKGQPNEIGIVLIADLHLGDVNSEGRLEAVVREINSLAPDIVCIAGDIFNDDYYTMRNPQKATRLLRGIEATYGTYACLGNHDGGSTLPEMMEFLEQSGIILLNEEHVRISERLILIGRLNFSRTGKFGELKRGDFSEIISQADSTLPLVVMDHDSRHISEYNKEVSLVLSGHTHRGQVFPCNVLARLVFPFEYGHYQKGDNSPSAIVTQGVGTWMMPMRVGTKCEVARITLRCGT